MTPLTAWQTFYVIVGSSAGALTGLQFVVMALIADLPVTRGVVQAHDAFATPTIVHFEAVLLLAGMLCAPWGGMGAPALLTGVGGVAGLIYIIIVARRLRGQSAYKPVFEDWFFYVCLPAVAYGTLAGAGYAVRFHAEKALFSVGGAALLLLYIGIHNAWDSVTYLVFVRRPQESRSDRT